MDAAIKTDIEPINVALFLAGREALRGEHLLRSLGACPLVIEQIRGASVSGVDVAKGCGVPLVKFSNVVEESLRRGPKEWAVPAPSGAMGNADLRALTRIVLPIAYRAVRLFPDLGQTHFGLTRFGAPRFVELAYRDLIALAESSEVLIELREANDPQFWNRLLTLGELLPGVRAEWGVTNWAFLSAGRVS